MRKRQRLWLESEPESPQIAQKNLENAFLLSCMKFVCAVFYQAAFGFRIGQSRIAAAQFPQQFGKLFFIYLFFLLQILQLLSADTKKWRALLHQCLCFDTKVSPFQSVAESKDPYWRRQIHKTVLATPFWIEYTSFRKDCQEKTFYRENLSYFFCVRHSYEKIPAFLRTVKSAECVCRSRLPQRMPSKRNSEKNAPKKRWVLRLAVNFDLSACSKLTSLLL